MQYLLASKETHAMSSNSMIENGVLPWTRGCFVCGQDNPRGLRLRSRLENGVVVLNYTTRESDLGYRNLVHGGIAATLLDEVMTWAAIVGVRRACVAAELTVRLKGPIAVARDLRVEGRVADLKARLLLTKGVILDDAGQTLMSATGKYVPMDNERAAHCSEDFVASPDSIDIEKIMSCATAPADVESSDDHERQRSD